VFQISRNLADDFALPLGDFGTHREAILRKLLLVVVIGLAAAMEIAWGGTVVISADPPTPVFNMGDVFSVQLFADLPDPIIGWGFDVFYDTSSVSLNSFVAGPDWFGVTDPSDPNEVGGLAFPTPVGGTDVLLGTLSFTALITGSITPDLAYDPNSPFQGFALLDGEFDPSNLRIEAAVPEPSLLQLTFLGIGLLALLQRRVARAPTAPTSR
jgi:hypothetical protein